MLFIYFFYFIHKNLTSLKIECYFIIRRFYLKCINTFFFLSFSCSFEFILHNYLIHMILLKYNINTEKPAIIYTVIYSIHHNYASIFLQSFKNVICILINLFFSSYFLSIIICNDALHKNSRFPRYFIYDYSYITKLESILKSICRRINYTRL